ncbi:1-pyrroline-5-carboxylate dehydrogenase [Burkholderia seminalis]|uniref:1-pyrroline-5-carboxylate dehydrogenase n=1 Tax=Burkholderia seminalis TaxID=488731 RepID=UPI000F5A2FF1|nr:1-pyrroline-5-carboxylate dehydrogenase [Burkholderia seminalis]RQS88041.1 1-pyrroline-5-carboxylate dehydrogenase [Burkholderia seminalis]
MTEDIETFLGTVAEATAKTVATGTGLPHFDVVKAINRMFAGGLVEREKRAGGGNEYVYWLARGTPAAQQPVAESAPAHAAPLPAMPIANLPSAAVGAIDTSGVVAELRADIERLTAELHAAQSKADTWRANAATLEARIDELTLGPVGARAPLFVTVGRNCKPQRHESLEKAQRRGRALVRSEKESEVLVLEPVGRIVRGTEWMPR